MIVEYSFIEHKFTVYHKSVNRSVSLLTYSVFAVIIHNMIIKTENKMIEVLKTFAHNGYQKTSMAKLGDAFCISRQALYKRFRSKELVLDWLVCEINAYALSGMKQALADGSKTMTERIVLGFDCWTGRYVDTLRSSPHSAEIMELGIIVARNIAGDGPTVAEKIRLLIARELVIEGIVVDLAEGERFAFVMYMASKGLTLSVPDRNSYLEKITEMVQTVIRS
ncbi:TetR/AcrR family transcriptional regulator [Shewanella sp. MF05960]|uniref:TetR/AcrR family transcriptional regulator n=1 Tax=Shewanella sp. MF05960 TaxID=3434874 RepID=UPI003D7B5A78